MFASLPATFLAATTSASAALPVEFGADSVTVDGDRGAAAHGNVHVSAPPFYLTSDNIALLRTSTGVAVTGQGLVSFCPCLGNPLQLSFNGATIAPPDDLILLSPRLSVFGVPLAWLPAFWLRSPAKLGILPPEIAYRGGDGLFLGEGVHVPLHSGDANEWLDLRAGAYVSGGAAADVSLTTERTTTHVRWDDLGTSGIALDGRGSTGRAAWELDAVRGSRAVASTTDLGVASLGYDRGRVASIFVGSNWLLGSGMRAIATRGTAWLDGTAFGPYVAAASTDSVGPVLYSGSTEAGLVRGPSHALYSDTRSTVGTSGRIGAFTASATVTGRALLSGSESFESAGVGEELRSMIALPLYRAFESDSREDPWVHALEPRLEVAQLATTLTGSNGPLPAPFVALPASAGVIALAGVRNSFGRPTSSEGGGFLLDVAVGGFAHGVVPRALFRTRGGADFDLLSLGVDGGQTLGPRGESGGAWIARARIGGERQVHLALSFAERSGIDPTLSRTLTSSITEPGGWLNTTGWTGRARLVAPLSRAISTRLGGDVDLTSGELLAVGGGFDLRDMAGCFVVHADAAHRVGRDGVDAWVSFDVPRFGGARR